MGGSLGCQRRNYRSLMHAYPKRNSLNPKWFRTASGKELRRLWLKFAPDFLNAVADVVEPSCNLFGPRFDIRTIWPLRRERRLPS